MKNTIFMQIAEIICPYSCISCAKVGGILCERCKKYIISQHGDKCLVCGGDLVNNQCFACDLPFLKQFYVGNREDILKKLINIYKYDSVRVCS